MVLSYLQWRQRPSVWLHSLPAKTIRRHPPMEHTHAYGSWVVVDEPTCTEEGLRERNCSCGKKETEMIAALGHTAGEAVRENEDAATCTAAGSYEEVVSCTVCEEELSRKTVTVDALRHSWGETKPGQAPTCTATGYTSYETCTRCGYSNRETIPALQHDWSEWVETTTATCTTAGEQKRTCTRCGYSNRETIPALQHDWSEYSVDETNHWRTCTREGCSAKEQAEHTFSGNTCEICGYAFYSEGLKYEVNKDTDTVTITGLGSCNDTTIYIPAVIKGKPVTEIGDRAFSNLDSLTEVVIPEGVTSIGAYAFNGCTMLAEIAIPEGVESIGEAAFQSCTSLAEIVIPEGVTKIDSFAFHKCNELTTVYYRGSEEQWKQIAIGSNNDALTEAEIKYNYTGE